MKSKLNELGKEGEKLASIFLQKKGFKIICMNYRHRHYEVDIIAQHEQMIVFIEVKRRNSQKYGAPEQFVNAQKRKNLLECANYYMAQIPDLTPLRFDIISIFWPDGAEPDSADIVHFEDAFY